MSDFGQGGPWSTWAASELVNLATSGMLLITGTWDYPPVQLAPYQAQMTAGLLAAVGSVTALYAGEGVALDLSTQEAALTFVSLLVSQYVYNGTVAAREGKVAAMTRIERAQDDWVYAGPGAAVTADYATFSRFLEISALGEERFLTPDGRMANWEEHQRLVVPKLKERTTEEWLTRAEEWHLTFAPVYTATELLHSDVLAERGSSRTCRCRRARRRSRWRRTSSTARVPMRWRCRSLGSEWRARRVAEDYYHHRG
jgi:crotonobetainyl-CoA:carnitine CoA-transferase CaiB-like acyl-CoA transferase